MHETNKDVFLKNTVNAGKSYLVLCNKKLPVAVSGNRSTRTCPTVHPVDIVHYYLIIQSYRLCFSDMRLLQIQIIKRRYRTVRFLIFPKAFSGFAKRIAFPIISAGKLAPKNIIHFYAAWPIAFT